MDPDMGCLNSSEDFPHVFGNIHLSGPCNRKCYFCIGQHMMALDGENNLDTWPLKNVESFVAVCVARGVKEVNVTGTNTDPLLYKHTKKLVSHLRQFIPGVVVGVRTNGAKLGNLSELLSFDKASITICSLDPDINQKMMGGPPSGLLKLFIQKFAQNLKVNVVLGPENTQTEDVIQTLWKLGALGVTRVNLREPYGQPHVGDPLASLGLPSSTRLGMPVYQWGPMEVTYWDVHYVEVESINLYANGHISSDYPITRGHDDSGEVKDQSHFPGGRIREQWVQLRKKNDDEKLDAAFARGEALAHSIDKRLRSMEVLTPEQWTERAK